jgi:hypothetical protein
MNEMKAVLFFKSKNKLYIYIYNMPQPKKGKDSRTKAVERARRSSDKKHLKERLEHESYLQSQFDEDGNLLNILETDEELLNDEQVFLVRMVNELSEIDIRSIFVFIKTKYNKQQIKDLLDDYYSNKDSKTWADTIFNLTYRCTGFLNLNDLLIDKFESISSKILEGKPTSQEQMTEKVFEDIISRCSEDIDISQLNLFELITTLLTIYSQNQPETCSMNGGGKSDSTFSKIMEFIYGLFLLIMIIWFYFEEKAPQCSFMDRKLRVPGCDY